VFPVGYELDLYILFRKNSIFKGVRTALLYKPYMNERNSFGGLRTHKPSVKIP
jgi:hypothetical protein